MPITATLQASPNQANPARGPIRRPTPSPTTIASMPAPAANSSIQLVPPMENMRPRLEGLAERAPTREWRRRSSVGRRQDHLTTSHGRQVAPERDVDRVRQAADRPASLVELAHVHLDDLEVPLHELGDDARRGSRGHD